MLKVAWIAEHAEQGIGGLDGQRQREGHAVCLTVNVLLKSVFPHAQPASLQQRRQRGALPRPSPRRRGRRHGSAPAGQRGRRFGAPLPSSVGGGRRSGGGRQRARRRRSLGCAHLPPAGGVRWAARQRARECAVVRAAESGLDLQRRRRRAGVPAGEVLGWKQACAACLSAPACSSAALDMALGYPALRLNHVAVPSLPYGVAGPHGGPGARVCHQCGRPVHGADGPRGPRTCWGGHRRCALRQQLPPLAAAACMPV